jgi:sporulation protein YlmC with PRC-barrel domain/ribosomal protein L40E
MFKEEKYVYKLIGKDVYDSEADKIGKVSNVGYSKDGKIALIVETEESKEEIIPFESISKVGDIILLKQSFQVKTEALEKPKEIRELEEKICPKCGRKNEPKARFCVKCGYKL